MDLARRYPLASCGSSASVRSDRSASSLRPPACASRRRGTPYAARSPSVDARRFYPQRARSPPDLSDLDDKEDSSLVLDANLTFVLGARGKMTQSVRAVPAHREPGTKYNALTRKIADFLKRTDHAMDEWRRLGRKPTEDLGRSRSATNIMIRSVRLRNSASCARSSCSRGPSAETLTERNVDECTENEADELSEMTADLTEEHSAATLASERLDAESAERLRLERELSEVQSKNKELHRTSERLEMELLYARADLNGVSDADDDGEGGDAYKQRYERVLRELEFTKRRLRQQHEDDLEQLIGLKKQLEKKLTDAYEEAEEQRQVVGQWKCKVQKLNGEMNDVKLLLEEQSGRNNLLEKKQRRFDSETQLLQDELKKERNMKERILREKELAIAEKYTVETTLADTRLELELKEEKLLALQREYDELTSGERTEEEVTALRRQKIELERRLHDQEEELDELASNVQLLEQAKLRLEMTVESMRKEAKKETHARDEEIEEIRGNAQKKVKALEQQLENEHEERTQLLRQKHELERRLASLADSERQDREGDEALIRKLKNDLRKTKVLLRDVQTQLDQQKEAPAKNVIRQLKNQLEDAESARALVVKAKQSLELELSETQTLLEDTQKMRRDAEDRASALGREKGELQSQVEENEEELAEVFKKYKAAIQQMALDQKALQEQIMLVSELETEKNQLKEQLAELNSKLENAEFIGDHSSNMMARRNEFKLKELESKLDLEQTTKARLEVQISRLKETVEKLQMEVANTKVKEQHAQEEIKKLQRMIRELKEELNTSLMKESEAIQKKRELEKRLESLEAEAANERTDLKLAKKRIEDLQMALQGEFGDSVSDHSECDQDDSDCDSVTAYLANHRDIRDISSNSRRVSSSISRSSTSSNLGKESSYA